MPHPIDSRWMNFFSSKEVKATNYLYGGILAIVAILFISKIRNLGSREKDFPPGPKTIPVLGNALIFPTNFPYLKFSEWAQEYGDVFSLKILNRTIIVISSPTAVKSILETNGAHTGNRIRSALIQRGTKGSQMSFEDMENPFWKSSRHTMQTFINKDTMGKHKETHKAETSQFMHDILEDPTDVFHHICRTTVSIMTTLLYGSRVPTYKNSIAETYFRGTKLINEVIDPTAHPPVDIFLPLQYVPKRWAYWKRLADMTRALREELYGSLYEGCERAVRAGIRTGCYVESMILDDKETGVTLSRQEKINTALTLMDAGAETTTSFLQAFIIALINHPHVQEKGQAEIDKVCQGRWPEMDDYEKLPYVRAIVDEVFRFRPILPIAVPHVNIKDVYYKDYRIPQDSILFLNVHGIYHDPQFYDHPEEFDPERYLKTKYGTKENVDLTGYRNNFNFGAGRRICPGEAVARRTIMINTMSLLWAFNFQKDGSGTGGDDFDSYVKPGLELAPKPFTCDSRPRSVAKELMIRDRFAKHFPGGLVSATDL